MHNKVEGAGMRELKHSGGTIPQIPEHLWADLSSVFSHLSLHKELCLVGASMQRMSC